ncbi:MAG: hypothetical protein KDI30_01840, partial [Pseudomonadales bacterium]|nr:hypothetical protein [Pseudomonadales bacterium]
NVLFDLSKMSLGSDWTGRYLISVYPVKESEAIYQLRELKEDKNPKRYLRRPRIPVGTAQHPPYSHGSPYQGENHPPSTAQVDKQR